MPNQKAVIAFIIIAGLIIIAMAVYIFTHFSSLSLVASLILITVGGVLLLAFTGILFFIMRHNLKK